MAAEAYIGSKNGNGVMHTIINNIPVHTHYYELYGGSGTVGRTKKEASFNYISEIDPIQFEQLKMSMGPGFIVKNVCARSVIDSFVFGSSHFIYLDPPYPFECRRSQKKLYRFEMNDNDHAQLLLSIRSMDCSVMISTRQNRLYDQELKNWRKVEISTADRGGAATEIIYMNYPEPEILHQYDYLGTDYIDRQRINRKIDRLQTKLAMLPALERLAIIQDIVTNNRAAVQSFLTMGTGNMEKVPIPR